MDIDIEVLKSKYFKSNAKLSAFEIPLVLLKETEKASLFGYNNGGKQNTIWIPKKLVNYYQNGYKRFPGNSPAGLVSIAHLVYYDDKNEKFFNDLAMFLYKEDSIDGVGKSSQKDNVTTKKLTKALEFVKELVHDAKFYGEPLSLELENESNPSSSINVTFPKNKVVKMNDNFNNGYSFFVDGEWILIPDSYYKDKDSYTLQMVKVMKAFGFDVSKNCKELLSNLEKLYKTFDKNYMMSDSNSVYKAGQAHLDEIRSHEKFLEDNGFSRDIKSLRQKYLT